MLGSWAYIFYSRRWIPNPSEWVMLTFGFIRKLENPQKRDFGGGEQWVDSLRLGFGFLGLWVPVWTTMGASLFTPHLDFRFQSLLASSLLFLLIWIKKKVLTTQNSFSSSLHFRSRGGGFVSAVAPLTELHEETKGELPIFATNIKTTQEIRSARREERSSFRLPDQIQDGGSP